MTEQHVRALCVGVLTHLTPIKPSEFYLLHFLFGRVALSEPQPMKTHIWLPTATPTYRVPDRGKQSAEISNRMCR